MSKEKFFTFPFSVILLSDKWPQTIICFAVRNNRTNHYSFSFCLALTLPSSLQTTPLSPQGFHHPKGSLRDQRDGEYGRSDLSTCHISHSIFCYRGLCHQDIVSLMKIGLPRESDTYHCYDYHPVGTDLCTGHSGSKRKMVIPPALVSASSM